MVRTRGERNDGAKAVDMKRCQIDFNIDGQKGHAVVTAPTSIDGLLLWLATIPQTSKVKALVKVLLPEVVQ
jgi:hypothetical protein